MDLHPSNGKMDSDFTEEGNVPSDGGMVPKPDNVNVESERSCPCPGPYIPGARPLFFPGDALAAREYRKLYPRNASLFPASSFHESSQHSEPIIIRDSADEDSEQSDDKEERKVTTIINNDDFILDVDWAHMVNCKERSDLTITTKEGLKIPAHQLVLYARYPNILKDMVNMNITWHTTTYSDALCFLKFIYCGKRININSLECKESIFDLVDRYYIGNIFEKEMQPQAPTCFLLNCMSKPHPVKITDSNLAQSQRFEVVHDAKDCQSQVSDQAKDIGKSTSQLLDEANEVEFIGESKPHLLDLSQGSFMEKSTSQLFDEADELEYSGEPVSHISKQSEDAKYSKRSVKVEDVAQSSSQVSKLSEFPDSELSEDTGCVKESESQISEQSGEYDESSGSDQSEETQDELEFNGESVSRISKQSEEAKYSKRSVKVEDVAQSSSQVSELGEYPDSELSEDTGCVKESESQISEQSGDYDESGSDQSEETQEHVDRSSSPDIFAEDEAESDSDCMSVIDFCGASNPPFETSSGSVPVSDDEVEVVEAKNAPAIEDMSAIKNVMVRSSINDESQAMKKKNIDLIDLCSDESSEDPPPQTVGNTKVALSNDTDTDIENPGGVRKLSSFRKNIFGTLVLSSPESKASCSQQREDLKNNASVTPSTASVKNKYLDDSFEFILNESVLMREAECSKPAGIGSEKNHVALADADDVLPCDVEPETGMEVHGNDGSFLPPNDEMGTPKQSTSYIIHEEVTPIPDFKNMDTLELKKQVLNYGLKPSLTRKQNVKMLGHIYKELHPLVEVAIDPKGKKSYSRSDENKGETDSPPAPKKSRLNDDKSAGSSSSNDDGFIVNEEIICTDEQNVATAGAQTDLKSAVLTFIKDRPILHDSILRYMPVQLETLQAELKDHLKKTVNLGQLKLILDDECITFQTKGRARASPKKKDNPKK